MEINLKVLKNHCATKLQITRTLSGGKISALSQLTNRFAKQRSSALNKVCDVRFANDQSSALNKVHDVRFADDLPNPNLYEKRCANLSPF